MKSNKQKYREFFQKLRQNQISDPEYGLGVLYLKEMFGVESWDIFSDDVRLITKTLGFQTWKIRRAALEVFAAISKEIPSSFKIPKLKR